MKVFLWLILISSTVIAQMGIKKQIFIGSGGTFPLVGDPSPTVTAGGAVIIPLGTRFFVRPAAAFNQNFPETGKPTRQLQTLAFLGFKVQPYLSVLVGRGETFLFPGGKPNAIVPMMSMATAWSPWKNKEGWKKGLGIFTPVNRTSTKGWGGSLLLGYTW